MSKRSKIFQSEIPRISLNEALRVPKAIFDNYAGDPTKPLDLAVALNLTPTSSHFRVICGAALGYGLTKGGPNAEVIEITELGKRILRPTEEGDDIEARLEALNTPTIIKEFLTKYNNSRVPNEKIALNVLRDMGVPDNALKRTFDLIINSSKDLGVITEIKGNQYVNLNLKIKKKNNDTLEVNLTQDEENNSIGESTTHNSQETEIKKDTKDDRIKNSQDNYKVFITHGKNSQILNQIKEIIRFGNFTPVIAEEIETSSIPVPKKVLDEMRYCYAGIIHVGKERKYLDEQGNEVFLMNQNVLIEIGAAMAFYDDRFILLVEKGMTLPSNLQGLYEVRYDGDSLDHEATMKLLKSFNSFRK